MFSKEFVPFRMLRFLLSFYWSGLVRMEFQFYAVWDYVMQSIERYTKKYNFKNKNTIGKIWDVVVIYSNLINTNNSMGA